MAWAQPYRVNWTEVDWGTLQGQCVEGNANRYALPATYMRQSFRNATAEDLVFDLTQNKSKDDT